MWQEEEEEEKGGKKEKRGNEEKGVEKAKNTFGLLTKVIEKGS